MKTKILFFMLLMIISGMNHLIYAGSYTTSGSTYNGCINPNIPAGATNVVFILSMTAGDWDLYVGQGYCPTTGTYSCRPYFGGTTTETCGTYTGGDWRAMVNPYNSGGTWTINVTWTDPCVAPGDQTSYGNNSWIGYVYSSVSAGAFSTYIGYVTENETFNRGHNTPLGVTTNLPCNNPDNLFAIRYRMNKTFPSGLYTFTIGGDDGVRLSIDGGSTWLINGWVDQGYTTYNSTPVYLNGNYNLVLEYYENGGGAQTSFSYTSEMVVPSSGSNEYTTCSGHLYDAGGSTGDYISSWDGYTVLRPSTSTNAIQISGTSAGESCCDYVYIYNGVGTAGTLLWSGYVGAGTIPVTTSTDATGALTVRFVSDGSVVGSGFDITIACVPKPAYRAQFISMNTGSTTWCPGETRNVTVTIQNTGTQSWTDWGVPIWGSGTGEDFNIGVKWDTDGDYPFRVDAQNLAPGVTQTFTLSVTAPSNPGTTHLTFNVVREAVAWFGGTYVSGVQAINSIPTGVSAGSDVTICSGASTQLSGSATALSSVGTLVLIFTPTYIGDEARWYIEDNSSGVVLQSGGPYNDESPQNITMYYYNPVRLRIRTDGSYNDNTCDWILSCNGSNIGSGSVAGGQNVIVQQNISCVSIPTISYSWTPTTGLNNSTIANPIATPTSSTTYTMTATTNGCGVSDNVVVTVNSLSSSPTSVSSTSNPICFGTSTTLSPVGGSLGTGASAVWYTGTNGGFTQDWVTNPYGSGGTTATVNAGILNVISTNGDPMIFMDGLGSYDPNIYRYVTIKYQITGGTGLNWEIFFYNTNHAWAVGGEEVAGSLISDGAWYTSTIDMWTDPEYRTGGNITGWRFDWAGNAGVTMNIDYITLTASAPLTSTTVAPTTNTTYFVRYEGQCNTSSSASTSITVSTPLTTGLVSTDYVWSGNVSTNWNSATNWLTYNGSAFTVAGVVPTSANNVFIRSYGSCASTNVATINSATANLKNLTIESGKTLTMSGQTINVSGNWTNAGTFNAGDGTDGTVNFNGSSLQTISGTNTFNNVTFNSNSIGIANPTIINGTATFSNGVVSYSGTGSLTFGTTATATVSSNNSFVDGAVSKTGSTAFTFPVGDVVSRDIGAGNQMYKVLGAISLTPVSSTTVSAEYHFDNSGMPDWWEHGGNMDNTLHHVSDREQWVINSPVDISATSLYWYGNGHTVGNPCLHGFDDGNASEFVASDLSVAYWDGSMWVNAGGTFSGNHDAGNISSTTAIPFGAKSSKIITFGSKNNLNPLPVELIFFEGTCENEQVILSWETATETNNDYFIVERSSNLLDWDEVEKVLGAGNSNQRLDYSISVVPDGAIYYRLTQVDYDGKYEVFPIINVMCDDDIISLSLYPNPTEDEIFFSEKVIYQVFSPEGKLVLEGAGNSISLGAFSPGMYAIKTNNHLYKVIKQ